jgi:hypothetical protein
VGEERFRAVAPVASSMYLAALACAGAVLGAGACGDAGDIERPSRSGDATILDSTGCSSPLALGAGWERCASGVIHREAVSGECPSHLPRPEFLSTREPGFDSTASAPCRKDIDCAGRAYGHCEVGGESGREAFCSYGCVTDADCNAGMVCLCGELIGECRRSSCTIDDDCESGTCSSYDGNPSCPSLEFACERPELRDCAVY